MKRARPTWAHAALKRLLDSPWPWMPMSAYSVPLGWTAAWALAWVPLAMWWPNRAAVPLVYVWHVCIVLPLFARIYFIHDEPGRQDLLTGVLNLLDVLCASVFAHVISWPQQTPFEVASALLNGGTGIYLDALRYSCSLLVVHMGARCTGKHTTRTEAAALADAEFMRLHQEADAKIMPALSMRRKK